MKGCLVWLPLRRTRHHWTDRLSPNFHVFSAMVPCAPPVAAPLPVLSKLTNLLPLSFEAQTKKPPWWFWGPNPQTVDLGFEAQTKKLSQWFWSQPTDKLPPSVLRLNQETRASRLLHMYDADHIRHHPTSRSSGHWAPNLCLVIPDPPCQVSYSCPDPHHCLPRHICHLHITRQANSFLHTK
jgi:hypothetical protein